MAGLHVHTGRCAARSRSLLITAALLSISACHSQPPAPEQRFIGAWRYVGETNTTLDGTPVAVPSPRYQGLLIYTADGFVSAVVMPADRHWNSDAVTLAELRASTVDDATTAYEGRYQVNAAAHEITHQITVSVDPSFEGRRLVRSYAFDADSLLLSGDWTYNGEPLRFTVSWIRAR
jgi:Lipocalin-like domain